jgi:hypothetical protein
MFEVMDATGYLAYQAPLPMDFPGYTFSHRVRGEVCQNDLHLPLQLEGTHANAALSGAQTLDILWGNAAVAQGVADAMRGAPQGAVLYDLALDLHRTQVFGFFFRRQCLVVSGSLALPQGPGLGHEVHDIGPWPRGAEDVPAAAVTVKPQDAGKGVEPTLVIPPKSQAPRTNLRNKAARPHSLPESHRVHPSRSDGPRGHRKSSAGHQRTRSNKRSSR